MRNCERPRKYEIGVRTFVFFVVRTYNIIFMKCRFPIDCVLALTYRCNSRCVMCDIWKMDSSPELPATDFAKLPGSLRDINLSGGEPFLRQDLSEIVAVVAKACPRARLIISSNGFATELIINQMKKILKVKPDIGVAISLDGVGEMHDEMRGIPGGYGKALKTLNELKKLGLTNLRLAFTLTDRNVNHLSKVYNLARELGAQFTHSFAQSSEFYFGGKQNVNQPRRELLEKEYTYLIREELKTWNLKRWARAYYAYGMFKFITAARPPVDGAPGRDFFFLDPGGKIYPSVVHNHPLGNIKDVGQNEFPTFEQFWCSDEVEVRREAVDASQIPVWMICTARTAIKKHPFRVGWWVLKNKFLKESVV